MLAMFAIWTEFYGSRISAAFRSGLPVFNPLLRRPEHTGAHRQSGPCDASLRIIECPLFFRTHQRQPVGADLHTALDRQAPACACRFPVAPAVRAWARTATNRTASGHF